MAELLFLLLIELVGLGAKELSFQIGNDRLGFGQLLRLEREFLLSLRLFLPACASCCCNCAAYSANPAGLSANSRNSSSGRLHPWSTSRKLRRNG